MWWCAAPQTPCWLPQGRCRCGTFPPPRLDPAWLSTMSPPGCCRPLWRTRKLQLHSSSSCSSSPRRPSTGPNTGSGTHERPVKTMSATNCFRRGCSYAAVLTRTSWRQRSCISIGTAWIQKGKTEYSVQRADKNQPMQIRGKKDKIFNYSEGIPQMYFLIL